MAKLAEPVQIEIQHSGGNFVASSVFSVGRSQRIRTGAGKAPAEALDRLLRLFRRAGHAGKRFEAKGPELAVQGAIGGWRKH